MLRSLIGICFFKAEKHRMNRMSLTNLLWCWSRECERWCRWCRPAAATGKSRSSTAGTRRAATRWSTGWPRCRPASWTGSPAATRPPAAASTAPAPWGSGSAAAALAAPAWGRWRTPWRRPRGASSWWSRCPRRGPPRAGRSSWPAPRTPGSRGRGSRCPSGPGSGRWWSFRGPARRRRGAPPGMYRKCWTSTCCRGQDAEGKTRRKGKDFGGGLFFLNGRHAESPGGGGDFPSVYSENWPKKKKKKEF